MEQKRFPIDYVSSTLTPIRAFMGRKQLNWFKIIIIIFFLNALIMIPITLHYSKMEWSLESTFPSVYNMIDDEVVQQLQQTEIVKGVATFDNSFSLETPSGIVAIGLSESDEEQALEKRNILLFTKKEMMIKEEGTPLSKVPYTNDVNWSNIETPEQVKQTIEEQWFRFNRVYIVASYSFMISFALFIMNLFLIFGSGMFIYLARRNSFEEKAPYKESVNIILNSMGVPVLLAFLFGLYNPDITILMTIQTLGLVLMIVAIYFQTRFSEKYLKKKQQNKQ